MNHFFKKSLISVLVRRHYLLLPTVISPIIPSCMAPLDTLHSVPVFYPRAWLAPAFGLYPLPLMSSPVTCKSLIPNPSTSVLISSFHFVKVILITQYLNFKLLFKIMQLTHELFFFSLQKIKDNKQKSKRQNPEFQVPEG